MDHNHRSFFRKCLFRGTIGGILLGVALPWVGIALSALGGGKIFAIIELAFLWPMTLLSALAQPIYRFEPETAFFIYALAAAVIWPLLGLLAGYLFFKWHNCRRQKYIPDLSPSEKKRSNGRIAVVLTVLVGFLVYSGILYSQIIACYQIRDEADRYRGKLETIKQQKNLDKKVLEMEAKRQKTEAATSETVDDKPKEEETMSTIWRSDNTWKLYENKKYDLAFDLPSNWSASEFETYPDYVNIKIVNLDLPTDERNDWAIWLVATKKNYIPDGPANGMGYCAVDFDTLDDFCASGCKRLNNQTAVDYRIVNHGEPIASAQAYSTASQTSPAICLEMSIYQEIDRIARKEGLDPEELMKKYDLRSSKDPNIPAELREATSLFERMADSITSSQNN